MKYTYKDCEKRLKEIFKDVAEQPAFAYVLEAVLENAKVDNDFVQNAMHEKKSFAKMMEYAQNKSMEIGNHGRNYAVLDENQMIESVIEYFNKEEIDKVAVEKTSTKKTTKRTYKTKTTKKTKVNVSSTQNDDVEMELPF